MPPETGASRPSGLLDSIARLGRTLLGALRTRLEILATEIEEERIRLARFVLALVAIAFCLQMAILLLVALLIVLFWESHRLMTLGLIAGLFAIAGIVGVAVVQQRLRTRPKMFASTIGELLKDESRLRGGDR